MSSEGAKGELDTLYSPHILLELWSRRQTNLMPLEQTRAGHFVEAFEWQRTPTALSPFYEQHLGGTDCILLIWTLIKICGPLVILSASPPPLLSLSLFLSCRRWRLPVGAVRERRHLRRQGWLIPLPLPAQLWRRHMRERWEEPRQKKQK